MKLYLDQPKIVEEQSGKKYIDVKLGSLLKAVFVSTILLNLIVLGAAFFIGVMFGFFY